MAHSSWDAEFWDWVKNGSTFTDWCIAAFTCVLAFSSIYQYSIMSGQLDEMRLDQRAWVAVHGIGGSFEVGKPWDIRIFLADTGKTPAINARLSCNVELTQKESDIIFNAQAYGPSTVIAPSNSGTFCVLWPNESEPDPTVHQSLGQEVKDRFSKRIVTAFVYGSVLYDDIYGSHHWLVFCRSMGPDGQTWNGCFSHPDDMGDGQFPPQRWSRPDDLSH